MPPMRLIADESQVDQRINELARMVDDRVHPREDWALVGIRSRGDVLARRLAQHLTQDRPPVGVGSLDITLYRDDLPEVGPQPIVRTTEVDFPIDGLDLVLVDDVLMTGRSVRAALQSLMDLGRPRRIWLAVLVDRGGRELPIAPDFVALDLTTATDLAPADQVQVQLQPTDDRDAILLQQRRH